MTVNNKREYRTERKADADGLIPDQLTIITAPGYQYSDLLCPRGQSYLLPCPIPYEPGNEEQFIFSKDEEYLEIRGIPESRVKLKEINSDSVPQGLDLAFLILCFSIYMENCLEEILINGNIPSVKIYYPNLAEKIYGTRKTNKMSAEIFRRKIMDLHTIVGICERRGLAVLVLLEYDEDNNTIEYSCPYIARVIRQIAEKRGYKNKQTGAPILSNTGIPRIPPYLSKLIDISILKEKNKIAIINVKIIVTIIEQAGYRKYEDDQGNIIAKGTPNISFRELLERNKQLKIRYDKIGTTQNKNKLLRTCFRKTWELLWKYTKLAEVYSNIYIPDPDDPANLPSVSKLDKVIKFSHNGKLEDTTWADFDKMDYQFR